MTSPITQFRNFWGEIPTTVQKFLIRVLIIFLVWKVAYHFVLKPSRVIDKPLTQITAKITVKALERIYPNNIFSTIEMLPSNKIDFFSVDIFKNGKKVLGIFDPCNGLELYVLYIGLLASLAITNWKRAIYFIIGGIASIFIINIVRCTIIGYLNINRSFYVDVAHHYIFKLIVYLFTFLLWVWYFKIE